MAPAGGGGGALTEIPGERERKPGVIRVSDLGVNVTEPSTIGFATSGGAEGGLGVLFPC